MVAERNKKRFTDKKQWNDWFGRIGHTFELRNFYEISSIEFMQTFILIN